MLSFFSFVKSKISIYFCPCFGDEGPEDTRPLLSSTTSSPIRRPDTPYPSDNSADSLESFEDSITFSHHHRARHGM